MAKNKAKVRKFPFKKPLGESERPWNQLELCTIRGVLCELCGTEWSERDDDRSYVLGRFLGRQFVEECCGKIVDNLYLEFGNLFAMAFLEDFAENPSDPRFNFFRFVLPRILSDAHKRAEEIARETAKAQEQIFGINKVISSH